MASDGSGRFSASSERSSRPVAPSKKRGSRRLAGETSDEANPDMSEQGLSARRKRRCESAAVEPRKGKYTPSAFEKAAQEPLAPHFLPFHPAIEMDTGEKVTHVPDWRAESAASDATEGKNFVGRMIGKITVNVRCAKIVSQKLLAAKTVDCAAMRTCSARSPQVIWDEAGEFCSDKGEHVPVSRLGRMLASGKARCLAPSMASSVLKSMVELQSPKSPRKRPLLRALSTHAATPEGINITYYVYVSRLLFERIADPSIGGMMAGLDPIAKATPPVQVKDHVHDFVSTRPSDSASSLSALLKNAENPGYPALEVQPPSLKVDLFDFQRSTFQWMLDQERAQHGLNGYLWEKRDWADSGAPFFYFPLGGQLRLAAPPHVTGGLLCEDVGLGKTVEVLSTILANPLQQLGKTAHREPPRSGGTSSYDSQPEVVSGATLIVVPALLLEQWADEIRKVVKPGSLRALTFEGSVDRDVPLSSLELPGLWSRRKSGRGSCMAPDGSGCLQKGIVTLTADQRRRLAAGNVGQEEQVRVTFTVDAAFFADNDVVLTTYDVLERRSALFRKVNFHRLVLDNCHEIQSAWSSRVCGKATHRWLVSGTPFVSGIDGLHEQLKLLQVAPFDELKGWEKIVGEPFAAGDPEALRLLDAVLRAAMMRHNKSQRRKDGSLLVEMPTCSVEWRGVDMATAPQVDVAGHVSGPHARYVYKYLEYLFFSSCVVDESLADNTGKDRFDLADFQKHLALLQRVAIHPGLVGLDQLQEERQVLRLKTPSNVHMADPNYPSVCWDSMPEETCRKALKKCLEAEAAGIRSLPGEDVLRCLMKEASDVDGPNRGDANEHWTVGGGEEMKFRNSVKDAPLSSLRQRLKDEGLPVPRSWTFLKPRADIATGSVTLSFEAPEGEERTQEGEDEGEDEDEDEGVDGSSRQGKGKGKGKGKLKEKRRMALSTAGMVDVREFLKVSDTIRVGANNEDNETEVASVEEISAKVSTKWVPGPVKKGRVYRFSESTRRKPYVELLVAAAKAKKSHPGHASSFADVYKAMTGDESGHCTICLSKPARPTTTVCGHLFCRDCVSTELKKEPNFLVKYSPSCPNCRFPMKGTDLMEIKPLSEEREAVAGMGTVGASGEAPGFNLFIPKFERTPPADVDHLRSAPMPKEDVESDPALPMLGRKILSQHRAAVMSPSSVKLDAVVRDLEDTLRRDPTSKFIILTQYQEVAEKACLVLKERGIRVKESCSGDPLNNDPAVKAIVLATGPGSSGLTLTGAQTVYMLDPAWNAADEALALNSVRRIGQTGHVRTVVFYVKDSVEERLLALRREKGNLGEFLEKSELIASRSFMDMFSLSDVKKLLGFHSTHIPSRSMAELPADPGLIPTLVRILAPISDSDEESASDMDVDDDDISSDFGVDAGVADMDISDDDDEDDGISVYFGLYAGVTDMDISDDDGG